MTVRLGAPLLAAAVLLLLAPARAEDVSDDALFRTGVASLERGAVDDAIDRFELLADRGTAHADLSFNRGVAYARRGGGRSPHGGDLGRAAAAFREALLLRPDDATASHALERVQHEIARRRARTGAVQMELRPALSRALIGLLAESTWAWIAAIASVVLTVGLSLRLFARAARVQLSGTVMASVSAILLFTSGAAAAIARSDRVSTRPAVVIVEEARLLDDNGAVISGPGTVLPEGSSVLVVSQNGTRARVEWGTLEGWLALGQLRLLAKP